MFTAYDTYYFEVTPDWSIEITNKGMEGPLNYLCYDFATDLFSSDHGAEEPDSNSILAKFRPTKNIELIRLCNPAKIVDPTKYKNLVSHDSQYSDSIQPDTDSMTPLPRASRPDPEVIPKFDPERLKEQHTESDNSDNFEEALVREGIHEAQSEKNEYVPKELFLQQQEVIYELQNQIQSLQREIISLKEKLAEKVQEKHVFPSKPNHEQFVDKDPPSCRLDYADENPPADPKPTYYYSSQETIRPQFIEDKSNEISEFQEEESFLCHKPFEPCEMEAPSIFNFDLFIQTLKDRQGIQCFS